MTERYEFEVDTTKANEYWHAEVEENLKRKAAEDWRTGGCPHRPPAAASDPMASFSPTSEETLEDQRLYTQARLTEVACLDCLARVRVKKNSEHHTSIQWDTDALDACAEFARMACRAGWTARLRDVRAAPLVDRACGGRRRGRDRSAGWVLSPTSSPCSTSSRRRPTHTRWSSRSPTSWPSSSPTCRASSSRVAVPSDQTGLAARCYSLSSAPHSGQHQITVKRTADGYASNWINDNLAAGDTLRVLPPSGIFTPKDFGADLLLFAGGSGITPVMSIVRTALEKGSGRVVLLYANRDEQSVIFARELSELVGGVRRPADRRALARVGAGAAHAGTSCGPSRRTSPTTRRSPAARRRT